MEQEDNITRSDRATIRRAIFDLKYYIDKHRENITSNMINIASSPKYSEQLFNELGIKSNTLNHYHVELSMLLKLLDTQHIKFKGLCEEKLSDKETNEIRFLFETKLYSREKLISQYSIDDEIMNSVLYNDLPSNNQNDNGSLLTDIKELLVVFKRFIFRLLLLELKRKK